MANVDYKTLNEDILSCPGMKYYQLAIAHGTSQHIFAGNYDQLRQLLLLIHDPEKSLPMMFAVEARSEFAFVQNDVIRLFHNFVAAALTLVAHTRVMMRDGSLSKEALGEYEKRIKDTFADNPLAGFIQDLRNYTLHKGIPFGGMELNWTAETQKVDTRVFLDLGKMKTSSQWSSRGKRYIAKAPEKITLLKVVEDYTSTVRSFHEWFIKWFMELHSAELDELTTLQKQWNEGIGEAEQKPPTVTPSCLTTGALDGACSAG
jgi:hypothetical protein